MFLQAITPRYVCFLSRGVTPSTGSAPARTGRCLGAPRCSLTPTSLSTPSTAPVSIPLFVYTYVRLCARVSVYLRVLQFVYTCLILSMYMYYTNLSACASVCLHVSQSISTCLSLSAHGASVFLLVVPQSVCTRRPSLSACGDSACLLFPQFKKGKIYERN